MWRTVAWATTRSPPSRAGDAVLGPGDPLPFEPVNAGGQAPCLIVCDHASAAIPEALGGLGVDPRHRLAHIAWDIGAAAIARRLAALFDAPALLAGYSRLVVDCNRHLDDPTAFVQTSDGIAVPGNAAMTGDERARRIARIYRPYHGAIDEALDRFQQAGTVPALVSCHTMTDRLRGAPRRRQEIAVCWALDDRIAAPLLARLEARADLVVGDNEPYGLDPGKDYTTPQHAMRRGLPHLQFEVRQDLVASETDAAAWAAIIHELAGDLIADPELRRVRLYWP